MTTLPAPLSSVLDHLKGRVTAPDWTDYAPDVREPAETVVARIDTLPTTAGGTFKAWATAHHGRKVLTLQVGQDGRNPWLPGWRTVRAGASYVQLDGSRRDYAGTRVIASSPDALIISTIDKVVLYLA